MFFRVGGQTRHSDPQYSFLWPRMRPRHVAPDASLGSDVFEILSRVCDGRSAAVLSALFSFQSHPRLTPGATCFGRIHGQMTSKSHRCTKSTKRAGLKKKGPKNDFPQFCPFGLLCPFGPLSFIKGVQPALEEDSRRNMIDKLAAFFS